MNTAKWIVIACMTMIALSAFGTSAEASGACYAGQCAGATVSGGAYTCNASGTIIQVGLDNDVCGDNNN